MNSMADDRAQYELMVQQVREAFEKPGRDIDTMGDDIDAAVQALAAKFGWPAALSAVEQVCRAGLERAGIGRAHDA